MMRNIIPMLFILVMTGILSCADEPEAPLSKNETTVAPPPAMRTVDVDARMSGGTLTPVDVYYMSTFPTGTWTYLATLMGTNCQNLGSFSAPDGSQLYFMVWDGSNNIAYHAKSGSCATTNDTFYCGHQAYATSMYTVTVNGSDVSVGMHVLVNKFTGEPMLCVD